MVTPGALQDGTQRTNDGFATSIKHVRIDLRSTNILMSQLLLYRTDIVSTLEQMRSEQVA